MTTPSLNPAELYEQFFGPGIFRPLASLLLEFAAPQPGERVLDVACGTGLVARNVAPAVGSSGTVVGVDINPAMLTVACNQPAPDGAAVEFRQGDATELDLPEQTFDLVLCQQGLQFFSDRAAALRKMHQVLAPGGRVALAVWQGIEQQTLFADFAEVEARHLAPLDVSYDGIIKPFSLGDAGQLRDLLDAAGFSRIQIESRTVETRFASPETFARTMETAYGAVVPDFVDDPEAFAAFVDAVEADTRDVVRHYTHGDTLSFAMPTNLVMGYVE